jgi:hypothetical protein
VELLATTWRQAGAKFAFDAGTLGEAANLVEETIAALEEQST